MTTGEVRPALSEALPRGKRDKQKQLTTNNGIVRRPSTRTFI